MKLIASLILAAAAGPDVDVPSGQPVTVQEVLVETVATETWVRFRFIAPRIARDTGTGTVDVDRAATDMAHLCETLALPYTASYELEADVIVISLADRKTEFGTPDPQATQVFEAFRTDGTACILESF